MIVHQVYNVNGLLLEPCCPVLCYHIPIGAETYFFAEALHKPVSFLQAYKLPFINPTTVLNSEWVAHS